MNVYFCEFERNGNTYRFEFRPYLSSADTYFYDWKKGEAIMVTPPTYIELPKFVIEDKISIEAGFEDDLPRGLELSKTMKLTINLDSVAQIAGLRESILKNSSSALCTVNYADRCDFKFKFPNVWTFRLNGELRFIGVQSLTPSRTIKNSNGYFSYEITTIEFTKYILESLKCDIDFYEKLLIINPYNDMPYVYRNAEYINTHYEVQNASVLEQIYNNVHYYKNANFYMISLRDLFEFIGRILTLAHYTVFRDATQITFNDIYYYHNFFQNDNTKQTDEPLPTVFKSDSAYIIGKITDGVDTVGGLFYDTETSWAKEYQTIWDLIKNMSQSAAVKICFNYSTMTYEVNPILEHDKTRLVDGSNCVQVTELTDGYSTIAKYAVHLPTKDGGDPEALEDSAIGTLAEESEEFAPPILQYAATTIKEAPYKAKSSGGVALIELKDVRCLLRRIYKLGTNLQPYSCKVDLDLYKVPRTEYNTFLVYPKPQTVADPYGKSDSDFDVRLTQFARDQVRQPYHHASKILTAYKKVFGNQNQAMIETEVNASLITTNDIGMKVIFNLNELMVTDFLDLIYGVDWHEGVLGAFACKGLVVSVKQDSITDPTVKVKIFVRADLEDLI